MINDDSVAAVRASRWRGEFVKPLYASYCFSRIPSLIEALFEGSPASVQGELLGSLARRYEKVILLFIDGYGWRFFQKTADRYPFLRRFVEDGTVTMLTSQFPSTTSVHTTTIHTGLDVGESGIYEWFMYEPALGRIITTLPFSYAGQLEPGTLLRDGVRPQTIFPTETVHRRLADRGIPSRVFGSKEFTPSPFTNVVAAGAVIHPFGSLGGGLAELAEAVRTDNGRGYYYLYWGGIDAAGHKAGPESGPWREAADACFAALERVLVPALSSQPDTLLLVTADHGQVAGNAERCIMLNRLYPELGGWFQRTAGGEPILPTGNYRDMVLHVEPERLEKAATVLQDRLEDRAVVVPVAELMDEGFLGTVTDRLTRRIGNLMVLPRGEELVWWEGYSPPRFRGYHGGLSPQEMEIELLAWLPGG